MYFYISILFQAYQVCGKITIGNFQHLLQVIEADLVIHHQDAHHTEADAVVKHFIKTCYRIFQLSAFNS